MRKTFQAIDEVIGGAIALAGAALIAVGLFVAQLCVFVISALWLLIYGAAIAVVCVISGLIIAVSFIVDWIKSALRRKGAVNEQ